MPQADELEVGVHLVSPAIVNRDRKLMTRCDNFLSLTARIFAHFCQLINYYSNASFSDLDEAETRFKNRMGQHLLYSAAIISSQTCRFINLFELVSS